MSSENKSSKEKDWIIRLEEIGNGVFKCKYLNNKGKSFAVKKIESNSWTSDEDWQSLMDLRNENVVSYHYCCVTDSVRYIVMDLCWASMMDFCLGRLLLQLDVTADVQLEIDRIMRETAVGLDFLHRSNIIHGRLGLDNILLWRKRPNLKFIVKISGYYPTHQRSTTNHRQARIEDDLDALGCVFYSMAANDVNPPKQLPVSSMQLSLISYNQRNSASQMINSLLNSTENDSNTQPTSVKDLLMGQSFFKTISATAEDRMKNVEELEDLISAINLNNLDSKTRMVFNDDHINGLKDILNQSKDVDEFATVAMDKYPKLFAEFVWDLSSYPPLEKLTFVERPFSSNLGGGAAGMVLAGKWIKPNGEERPVACKRFNNQDKFYKEYEALCQLDHLFVVKCFGTCEIQLDKCILMDLCEGSLKHYVLGELKSIPKDSLDDKIILGQVTLGLAYIHSQEMIHKDLKPANILLWRSPNCQSLVVAKLADFDFAKQLRTASSEFSGTYHPGTKGYMAPELLAGPLQQQNNGRTRKVFATVASDAYSLGITIGFTVLKGKHPYGNVLTLNEMMKSGADPILLGHLEWDVMDLILRLTRTDPKERPNVHFLIYHPYFVSANEKSKEHFVEKLDDYFNLFLSPYQARMTYINKRKIEEWMEIVTSQKERESNAKMKIWLAQQGDIFLKDLSHLENSQKYYDKIKEGIQRDNENEVNNSFHNETSKSQSMMDYFRDWTLWTRRLIQSAPQFSLTYFWCLINDRIVEENPDSKHPLTLLRRHGVKPPEILRAIKVLEIEEHVHACLHFKCREEIEEIWNHKRAGLLSAGLGGDEEIHRLLRELPSYAAPSSIINNLINRMDNINSKYDEDQTTVLHWILKNRWETIEFSILEELLKREANPNVGDKHGTTPVHYAAKNESSQGPTILQFLLENGGDPDQVNGRERQRTPLHYAAMNESSYAPIILNILLEFKKAKVNLVDKHGFTALHYAARNISKDAPVMLKNLLDNHGDPNKTLFRMGVEPPFHRTPVHMATLNESPSGLRMLKILLERDGNPNVYDLNRETPAHYAAKNQSNFAPEMMKILLENKGNVKLMTHQGKLPIHFAAENQSPSGPSIIDILLRHGGNPNIIFRDGGSPVHLAAQNPSDSALKILEILLDNDGNPNQLAGFSGASPVHLAAESHFSNGLRILKLLLEKGGDPNVVDVDGRTPVHSAAKNQSDMAPDLLKLLLLWHGNPNAGDNQKITPVHLAAASKSDSATVATSILKILLDNGGNCNVVNQTNQTPLDLAVENTSESAPRLLEILLAKGFDPNVANPSGATSVHLAAANQSNSGPKILTLLLAKGGNCNAVDGVNKTPLHYAAENQSEGATEMVTILLDQGCDPDAISSKGLTPVHLAATNESSSALGILKLLNERGANLAAAIGCGTTAVHLAAGTQSNTDVMEYLLDNVGNDCVNAFDVCPENFGKYFMDDIGWRSEELQSSPGGYQRMRTPVHHAAESEAVSTKSNVLKLLLERGGDPNLNDERNRTAVHLAVRNGGMDAGWRVLKVLLKNKGNPNAVDSQKRTPVHLSALTVTTYDKVKMMQLLMKYDGNPNAVDSSGRTPVHYAAMNVSPRAPEIIELLLENGGNPNLADHLGLTPVHCCVSVSVKMTEKILELLLKHGGDPDIPDNQGKTPIDLVANSESSDKEKLRTILKRCSKKSQQQLN